MLIKINQFSSVQAAIAPFDAPYAVFYHKNGLDADHIYIFLGDDKVVTLSGTVNPTEAALLVEFPNAIELGNSFITDILPT